MAGETRGELAEAIAKVALERAVALTGRNEQIFWQESPDGAVIKPDFTIGVDSKSPSMLVMVNASESPKESEKKYWRNVGEIFDTKSRLSTETTVLNLVFRSEIKPELVRLIETICDATLLVDRDPAFGSVISQWLDKNHAAAPSKRDERVELVLRAVRQGEAKFDASFAQAMKGFEQALSKILFDKKDSLTSLWTLCRADYLSRIGASVRPAKITMLRRGLARWLVFDGSIRTLVLVSHLKSGRVKLDNAPAHVESLGMLKETIGSYAIPVADDRASDMLGTTSRDLRLAADFFLEAAKGNLKEAATALNKSLENAPDEMVKAAELLRKMPSQVTDWHNYCLQNWKELIDPLGCYALLNRCYSDPTMCGEVSNFGETRVWLYDHLVAILRSYKNLNNDFGYSRMMAEFKEAHVAGTLKPFFEQILSQLNDRQKLQSIRWIERVLPKAKRPGERGFLEWLKGEKQIADVSIFCFSYAVAKLLKDVKNPSHLNLADLQQRHAYNLWNKLLTHQDFEPLPTLIETACSPKAWRVAAPSIMGEIAGGTVQDAGKMPVFAFKDGLIFWQSVTEAGRDHKRKELCGRARALKYTIRNGAFKKRQSASRMLLVIDGEWRDEDIRVFYESGWDEIFYPDEMEKLAKAIE
ncbi:MAG: hypothetical protein RKR03_03560 [Candidatus Competibacter sp.]|nr:hypothetical protein [Candidatus Competibacter sp.]